MKPVTTLWARQVAGVQGHDLRQGQERLSAPIRHLLPNVPGSPPGPLLVHGKGKEGLEEGWGAQRGVPLGHLQPSCSQLKDSVTLTMEL